MRVRLVRKAAQLNDLNHWVSLQAHLQESFAATRFAYSSLFPGSLFENLYTTDATYLVVMMSSKAIRAMMPEISLSCDNASLWKDAFGQLFQIRVLYRSTTPVSLPLREQQHATHSVGSGTTLH
jgi:hypothetical protein